MSGEIGARLRSATEEERTSVTLTHDPYGTRVVLHGPAFGPNAPRLEFVVRANPVPPLLWEALALLAGALTFDGRSSDTRSVASCGAMEPLDVLPAFLRSDTPSV